VDPDHFVSDWLNAHAHAVWRTKDFKLYLPPLPPDAPEHAVTQDVGEALHLESIAWEPAPVPAGEALRLSLRWRLRDRPEHPLWLTLQLVDESGHVWDEVQHRPQAWADPDAQWTPGQMITDYEGLRVPQGAPPGQYLVRLMVTDDATGEPLRAEGKKWLRPLTLRIAEPSHAPVLHSLSNPEAATFCPPEGGDCLVLAGHEPGGVRFQPGHSVPLTLHWLSPSTPLPELQLRLRVMLQPPLPLPFLDATPVLTRTIDLAPAYPAPAWGLERLVTLPAALTLPPDAPPGRAEVTLEVGAPDEIPWTTSEGSVTTSLFPIVIEERPVSRQLPAGLTPIEASFGEEVELRGYRVEGDPRPGGQLELTYGWYVKEQPTAIYAVFNHLKTAGGSIVAQADGWPQQGRLLTIQWRAGEYIEDSYTLDIPPDAPPGPYALYVGMYNAANNERQAAFQDGQSLPEGQLRISLPGEEGP
jgi:hypothetical protein